MSKHMNIRWKKSGNAQWTANEQVRNGVTYSAVVTHPTDGNYLLTINPGAVVSNNTTLGNAKNGFRKYLLNK